MRCIKGERKWILRNLVRIMIPCDTEDTRCFKKIRWNQMYGASLSPTMRSVSGKVILQQIWTYPLLYLSFNLISSSFSHCAKQSKIFRKILRVKGSIDEEQAFSLAVIEKQFIVTREIGIFGEGNVRKITRPISTLGRSRRRSHRPITRFCNFLPYRIEWS